MAGNFPTGLFFILLKLNKNQNIRFPTLNVRRRIQSDGGVNLREGHPLAPCGDAEEVQLGYAVRLGIPVVLGSEGD
jgi:hypothetical protein